MPARKPRRPCKQCGNAVPYHRVLQATAAEHYCMICVPRSAGKIGSAAQRDRIASLSAIPAPITLPGVRVASSFQITNQKVARIAQGKR